MPDDIQDCRLYIISPPALDPVIFKETLATVLDAGDVAAFQLRLEKATDEQWERAAELLMPLVQERSIAFILNDKTNIAKKTGADGVHLGRQDMSIHDARKLLGDDAIIGASAIDSRHAAMTAAERGASYVSFSPFFESRSPFYPAEVIPPNKMVDLEIIRWWQETMEIPCVAAGGIRPDNCASLVTAGADFICASTAIWTHPQGAAAAVRAFNDAISQAGVRQARPAQG